MDATYSAGQSATVPAAEDYRRYDRIWQRVSPELNPYPEVRAESGAAGGDGGLEHLPGAQADPCCMGSAAEDTLQVLEGFMEDERAGRQFLTDFACRLSQPRMARALRQMAAEKTDHIRQLEAAYYLTTGQRPASTIQVPAPAGGTSCCQTLRSAYHDAACLGFNYLRSADGTADLCLQHMFQKMGREAFQQADRLLQMVSVCLGEKHFQRFSQGTP